MKNGGDVKFWLGVTEGEKLTLADNRLLKSNEEGSEQCQQILQKYHHPPSSPGSLRSKFCPPPTERRSLISHPHIYPVALRAVPAAAPVDEQ